MSPRKADKGVGSGLAWFAYGKRILRELFGSAVFCLGRGLCLAFVVAVEGSRALSPSHGAATSCEHRSSSSLRTFLRTEKGKHMITTESWSRHLDHATLVTGLNEHLWWTLRHATWMLLKAGRASPSCRRGCQPADFIGPRQRAPRLRPRPFLSCPLSFRD